MVVNIPSYLPTIYVTIVILNELFGNLFVNLDEVGAIVVDVGSGLTKAGYAGDDQPKAIFPSVKFSKLNNHIHLRG